jgi:hypothetical protein
LFDFRVFVRVSKPDFPRIFCSSFKLFEHQTVRSSRVHCIYIHSIYPQNGEKMKKKIKMVVSFFLSRF